MIRWMTIAVACVFAKVPFAIGASDPLAAAKPGEIVRLNFDQLDQIPILDAKIKPAGGEALLFSDGPEYFPGDGIALREEVKPGPFRLYIYHCPESTGAKKTITATIDNLSDQPMKLRFLRYGFEMPGGDYLKIGQAGLIDYFSARKGPADRVVAPHARAVIDPEMDKTLVVKDDLVHAFHEIEVDQPARVTVFQKTPSADSLKIVDELKPLDPKHHGAGRGKFVTTNFDVDVAYDTADGPRQIVIADGKRDPWIKGHDAIANAESSNKGNYGTMYRLRISRKSSDGRGLVVLICKPQEDSNKYCPGSAAAVKVGDEVVPLPKEGGKFKMFPQAVMIRNVGNTGDVFEMTYSPPGASCLPTPILLVPIDSPGGK